MPMRFKLLMLVPFFVAAFGMTPVVVLADCAPPATTAEAIRCGSDNAAGVPPGSAPSSLDTTIANVVNLISLVVGVAAVIMIIVGGFRYITSGGNQEGVKSAKNTIIYAIIGLVIVALAQIIVKFVLNQTVTPAGS